MSDSDSTGGVNRRREQRLDFVSDCRVELVSPAWLLLPEPLAGKTQNLTMHGLKVILPRFPRRRHEQWKQAIADGEEMAVNVRLDTARGEVVIRGNVVWSQYTPGESSSSGACSVGVLLGIAPPAVMDELRKLVTGA